MFDRSFVLVDGPPGSGKTAFVEHLLRATDRTVQAVRCQLETDLDRPRESSPAGHPELKRYRRAGADGAVFYRFPEPDFDAFFSSSFMADPSDIVLEGRRPIEHVDLDVFVGPTPAPRGKLLRKVKRNLARERRESAARLRNALGSREGSAKLVEELLGTPLARLAESHSEMLDTLISNIEGRLDRIESVEPPRGRSERWEITEPYRGIERARLVVINTRGDAERRRGLRSLEDVRRLRNDVRVFEDVLWPLGRRTPITAVVADLSDERDPGVVKAVRRALRVFRG